MAYATYITDALVCGIKNSNTSDRSYLLFTREAGMLFASARSVREERSKQRYALQEFALVRVSLIRGKSGWRIGSVEALKNYYQLASDKEARGSVVEIFRHLRRFIHGEEVSTELYDFVLQSLDFVARNIKQRKVVNKVIKARLLHSLGYVSEQSVPVEALNSSLEEISHGISREVDKKLEKALENAILASQL